MPQIKRAVKITGKERIQWLDIAKGIAIILMIFGHVKGINPYLRMFIFSFHMPLFMIINGYLIKNYNPKETLKKSAHSLVIPYAVVCLLQVIVKTILSFGNASPFKVFLKGIADSLIGVSFTSTKFTQFGSVSLVWFVVCLFFARNIYVLLMSLISKTSELIRLAVLFAISLAGYFIGIYYAFLPWSLDVALYSVIFIAAGDILRKESFFENKRPLAYVIPCAIWICFLKTHTHIELAVRNYPFAYGGAISAIAGAIVVIALSKYLDERVKQFSSLLAWYGKNSMLILGVHCMENKFIPWNQLYGQSGIADKWLLQALIRFGFVSFIVLDICLVSGMLRDFRGKMVKKNGQV